MAGIAHVITPDSASGAQVIDGSLFLLGTSNSQKLNRTPSVAGNTKTWTFSCWMKKLKTNDGQDQIFVAGTGPAVRSQFYMTDDSLAFYHTESPEGTNSFTASSSNKLRDVSGWYHILLQCDITSGYIRCYVNNKLEFENTSVNTSYITQYNKTHLHTIGNHSFTDYNNPIDAQFSNIYFLDGLALGPGYFGYVDPLTNTWRPKKFRAEGTTVNDGTVWSSGIPGNTLSGYPATNGFDGNTSNYVYADNGTTMTWTAPKRITGQLIEVYVYAGNLHPIVKVNGQSTGAVVGGAAQQNVWVDVTDLCGGPGGSLQTIQAFGQNIGGTDRSSGFAGVRVDGITLIDSTTTNLDFNSSTTGAMSGPWTDGFRVGSNGSYDTRTSTSITSGDSHSTSGNNNMLHIDTNLIGPDYEITFTKTGGDNIHFYDSSTGSSFSNVVASVSGNFVISSNASNRTYSYNRYLRLGGTGGGNATFSIVGTANGAIIGVNGFYLPMDGNSPIGQDQSGNGNDFTPVNFGGSVALDNPIVSGARPILNTLPGGTQAGVGVFGSKENKIYVTTTANGSVYQFDITSGNNPSLEFIRGATYKFDYSSHTGHPVLFSSTNPDSSTTAYTNGTSIASNVISFTVPHNAPDTLYYYCQNHPTGMNGSISVTTDETKADPYAWKCTLALPCIGTSDDVSHLINCTTSELPIVDQGNAHADFSTGNFYGGSYDLDNSGDYINVNSSSPYSHVNFGTGDYTAECWVYLEGTGDEYVFNMVTNHGGSAPHWNINFYGTNLIRAGRTDSSGDSKHQVTTTFATNKWMHIAVSRGSGTSRLFLDGVLIDTQSDTDDIVPSSNLNIGAYNDGSLELNGFVQDARIYNGVAKYTSDFVVASTSPNILPDTPSGVSGSSKLTKITDGAVTFDGTGDYLSLPGGLTDMNFGTGDFTVETFIYVNNYSDYNEIFSSGQNSPTTYWQFAITQTTGTIYAWYGGSNIIISSSSIPLKRWVHVAWTRTGTTMNIWVDGISVGSATNSTAVDMNGSEDNGAQIGSYNNGASVFDGFMSNFRVIKGTGLYTSDFTPPTRALTNVTNTKLLCCQSNVTSGAAAVSPNISGINDGTVWSSTVTGPTRKEDRVANAFNGSTSGPGAIAAYPGTLTFAPGFTGLTTVKIYGYYAGSGVTLHVNGSQQSPSSGAFTLTISTSTLDSVVWTATNGFNYMRIDAIEIDSTVLIDPVVGPDDSNEAATNFNPFITDINAVRGQETGYATFNPLITPTGGDSQGSGGSLSDGNLTIKSGGSTGNYLLASCSPSIPLTGKYYFEFTTISAINTDNNTIGIFNPASPVYSSGDYARINPSFSGSYTTTKKRSGTATNLAGSAGDFSGGDVVNIAIDSDNRSIWFGKNGVYYEGNPSLGTGASYTNLTAGVEYVVRSFVYNSGGTEAEGRINFGQKPFKFAPPEGYQPLNDANVRPETVITRPDKFVGIATYAGNSTGQFITMGMKPDFLWIKSRTNTGSHAIQDSVRGSAKQLQSNTANEQSTNSATAGVLSFDLNGYTLGTESSATGSTNGSQSYVAWGWKAGGGKPSGGGFFKDDVEYASAAAAGLGGGSMTLTGASVGTKQGFSIVTYEGTNSNESIPHGLGSVPAFYICKAFDNSGYTDSWNVYHKSLGNAAYLKLQSDADATTGSTIWNSTSPTDSLFYVASNSNANENGIGYVSYIWSDVPGLQKFGSYIGNDNTNGTYIELGFKPALIIIKSTGSSGNWGMWDTTRDPSNPAYRRIRTHTNNEESGNDANVYIDILSNGFKLRNGDSDSNDGTYVYMAWAESPTINLFGTSANAR